MIFNGYCDESFAFLTALPTKDPAWFKSNKADYQRLLAEPTKALVVELGQQLQAKRPALEAQPKTNGSIAPINNDLRFSPNAAPYKDHLMLRFWEGTQKKTAPTLMVHIGTDKVGFASGIVPADVGRWRESVAGETGHQLQGAIKKLTKSKKADVIGQELKRVPAPYEPDHPRSDLLRHKILQVRWVEPLPAAATKPAFAGWLAKRLAAALPLHETLVDAFE